ncbi:MAG: GGDEF domain-containing protein [Acidobacteriaceae bacterium]
MISLKRYLDSTDPAPSPGKDDLLSATMESFQSTLRVVGAKAAEACPAHGCELRERLRRIGSNLSLGVVPPVVRETQQQVEAELTVWAERTADHCRYTAAQVRELLLALAGTAEAIGTANDASATQFRNLTADLESIVALDDLVEIRVSLEKDIVALKSSVEEMTRAQQAVVRDLRTKVSTCEEKLSEIEPLVYRDEVTGIANRRGMEERIRAAIARAETFCIVMLDLNGFKAINDAHGHETGDNLLQQFAHELTMSSRSGDFVGRWGGDEFMVLLGCDAAGAATQIDRLRRWVFGDYTVPFGAGDPKLTVRVDAAVGLAAWQPDISFQQLIAEADKAMYRDKRQTRPPRPGDAG